MQHEPDEAEHRLMIVDDGSLRFVPLHRNKVQWRVGRSADCDIEMFSSTVSRDHLLIEFRDGRYYFKSRSRSNPVTVDGKLEGEWREGQTLAVGLAKLTLQRRRAPTTLQAYNGPTQVVARQVADPAPADPQSARSTEAALVLARMEKTFANFGAAADAAESLLELAMTLTGRRRGWIGRSQGDGRMEKLAAAGPDRSRDDCGPVPPTVLAEARRIASPQLLSTSEGGVERQRLVVPLGPNQEGLLVLEDPAPHALADQDLLALAGSLANIVWRRLAETMERICAQAEVQRLRSRDRDALVASRRLEAARAAARGLAGSNLPVLLVGEEGTEREELARFLHAASPRRSDPFLACSARRLSPATQVATLFGSAPQAPGLWQRAANGTLLIDHAEVLEHETQRRLLAAWNEPIAEAPVLILASASSVDGADSPWLPELTERLRSQVIAIPPLRADSRDVLALAELFLEEMGPGPRDRPRTLSSGSQALLKSYHWPENVRELRAALETAAAAAGSEIIQPRHLPAAVNRSANPEPEVVGLPTLAEVERQHIATVMQQVRGNRSRAAQALGIASSTLYEKLRRYRIDS